MHNSYCVIMGGGIGSRFWPFSREANPKQFLDFFGTGRSLLQMTYDRFSRFIPRENIYVITNDTYAGKVADQLPQLPQEQILREPCRRNTAPCIAFASYHIQAINPKANVIVAPSDHLILKEDEFVEAALQALRFVADHPYLVTLGIRPSRPETGYGYIQMGDALNADFIKVKTFTEKPNAEMAQVFLDSGEFLWNSGMFVWNMETITQVIEETLPEVSSELAFPNVYNTPREAAFIAERFPRCPNISIDYGLMEKSRNAIVLPVDFGWADLGSWGSLYELGNKDEHGNVALKTHARFYEAERNLIILDDPNRIAIIQGVSDCVVVESDNVLLICKQDEEQRIKHFSTDASIQFGADYA